MEELFIDLDPTATTYSHPNRFNTNPKEVLNDINRWTANPCETLHLVNRWELAYFFLFLFMCL